MTVSVVESGESVIISTEDGRTLVKHSERTIRKLATRVCSHCDREVIFYWGHDLADTRKEGEARSWCSVHQSASFVPLEKDLTPHACAGKGSGGGGPRRSPAPRIPEPKAIPAPETGQERGFPQPESKDGMDALRALIRSVAPGADPAQIASVVDARLAEDRGATARMVQDCIDGLGSQMGQLLAGKLAEVRADMLSKTGELIKDALREIGALPTRVEVKRPNGEVKKVKGLSHSVLPKVIKILNLGEHILMVGPAGTGKSHIGKQAAEALDLPFWAMSVGPTMLESKLLGYMDAKGEFVPTAFYSWCKDGGVFLLDEVDNGNPSVLNVLNSALSNGFVLFPNGELVNLNDTCLCIAAANTYGTGPDRAYVGRQALDAAFRDRFCVVDVPVDEALERALCLGTGLPEGRVDRALTYVRHLRKNAEDAKLPVVIGVRKARRYCALVNAGFPKPEAEQMALSAGITATDWAKITANAPSPYSI